MLPLRGLDDDRDDVLLDFVLDFLRLVLEPPRDDFAPPRFPPLVGAVDGAAAFDARFLTLLAARVAFAREAKLSPDDAIVRPFEPTSFHRHLPPLSW